MSEKFVTPCPLPTDREREILTILIEECAEVQQRASKMLRFGRDETQPGYGLDNRQRLSREVGDLQAMVQMAIEANLIDALTVAARRPRKLEKLAHYMQTELPPSTAPSPVEQRLADLPLNLEGRKYISDPVLRENPELGDLISAENYRWFRDERNQCWVRRE